jgi:hypothetical protein
MNLKLIDRKSSDLTNLKGDGKARVTLLGDTLFEYKAEEPSSPTMDGPESIQDVNDRAIRTQKEIELDGETEEEPGLAIRINVIQPKQPKRSILKNKGVSIFIAPEN